MENQYACENDLALIWEISFYKRYYYLRSGTNHAMSGGVLMVFQYL